MVRKKSKTKSSKKVSKRKSVKKTAKRKSSRKNPKSSTDYYKEQREAHEKREVKELQEYFPGTLTPAKLRKLKDEAYDIDKLYRTGKRKEWEKADAKFIEKNGKLGSILLESAEADSCPYAAKC